MFKKAKTKLFIGFGGAVLLVLLTIVVFSVSIWRYSGAVDILFYVDHLDAIINNEITGVWRFLAGDENGAMARHIETHKDMFQLKNELKEKKGRRIKQLYTLALRGADLKLREFFHGENGFFQGVNNARNGFVDKNNKHIRRILGYLNNWTESGSAKETRAFEVLDLVRRERILFEEFNPRSADANEKVEQFRKVNDEAVAGLVYLWQEEINTGIMRATSAKMKKKLQTLKKVVSQITATSFPSVSEKEAELLGIKANQDTLFGLDADKATKALSKSCEEVFAIYEKKGIVLWSRGDVPEVGKNVTPTLTLAKIVSCQQGLRVNAEDMFRFQIAFVNKIEPELLLIQGDLERFKKEVSDYVKNLAITIQIIIVVISLSVIFLIILLELFVTQIISKK